MVESVPVQVVDEARVADRVTGHELRAVGVLVEVRCVDGVRIDSGELAMRDVEVRRELERARVVGEDVGGGARDE